MVANITDLKLARFIWKVYVCIKSYQEYILGHIECILLGGRNVTVYDNQSMRKLLCR